MSETTTSIPNIFELARTGQLPLANIIQQASLFENSGDQASIQKLYEIWLEHTDSSEKFAGYYNLGVSLANTGQVHDAEKAYRKAISLNPDFPQGYLNLGLAVERLGRLSEALSLWMHVVDQGEKVPKESRVFALNNIGRVNEACRQFEAAENALVRSLELNPRQPGVLQHVVSGRQRQCKWPVITDLAHNRRHDLLAATSALSMLAVSDDPAMQWLASLTTLNRFCLREGFLSTDKKYNHSKIRIGYLSGDLCTHAVGLLMADLIEAHDPDNFETYAFDYSPEDGTIFRARLKKAFNHFSDVRNLSDQDVALFILHNEIDVLIDLQGWSSGARPGILALRPAPVQMSYLGYFGSTLSPWIDYVITDKFVFTDELIPYFSEKPLFIDGTVIPLAYTEFTPTKITKESQGLPENATILASFNNINKVTPELFNVWMNILRKTENTILWLLDDNPWATNNLRLEAKKLGLDSHVIFASRTNLNDYRERMQLADLYLDTFPYNAGSTARDVLDMRLPILTCSGRTPIARMAGSIMSEVNLPDFIVNSLEAYETKAIELAKNKDYLAIVKNRLRENAPLLAGHPKRFIQSLEKKIKEIIASRL